MPYLIHPEVALSRSRLGLAARWGDTEAIAEARRDLAAAKLQASIERTLAEAPELSPEQRARLAALLNGGA